ncbi:hypothetical protein HNR23_001462 [Nocardiopsis mwathae]|uniref:Uncharacterized protein n=1 Tax=Nocardiopsis mwathae TaxID=1472723 RepID=A0A7W9YG10_9ACTN|nr:hypothetical protein [Nocardiopsis mwathae]
MTRRGGHDAGRGIHGHLIDGVLRAGADTTLAEVYAGVVRPALGIEAYFGVPEHVLARAADLEYADAEWPRRLPALPWMAPPAGAMDMGRMNSPEWRRAVFGAINLHTTASAAAKFFADLTREDGPVRALLGPRLHGEFLRPQVTGHDDLFGTEVTWTPGFVRDHVKIAKGGLGGSAAWWSLRHHHACAYLTRRLDDHARAAEIAAALGDDLTVMPLR